MGAVVTPVKSEMLSVCLVAALLCSSSLAGPLPREEDRQGDLIIGLLTSLIQDQINNALGITTTRGTPVIDLVGGLLGGTTTTTASPAAADGWDTNMILCKDVITITNDEQFWPPRIILCNCIL